MHQPNGYKPHGRNNNKGVRATVLLTQQQELTQEQKNLQYQQLNKFKCQRPPLTKMSTTKHYMQEMQPQTHD
eukprot:Pgem_evm1s10885